VEERRAVLGLSWAALAARFGINAESVRAWVYGKQGLPPRGVPADRLADLEAILGPRVEAAPTPATADVAMDGDATPATPLPALPVQVVCLLGGHRADVPADRAWLLAKARLRCAACGSAAFVEMEEAA
jgi:hypothetical protein